MEALLKGLFSLNAPVGKLADLQQGLVERRLQYFFAVKFAPLAVFEFVEEGEDNNGVHKVDESKSLIAFVLRGVSEFGCFTFGSMGR